MSLRRTALTRKTALRRGPMPRRIRAPKDRVVKTARRQRDTGPSIETRALVAERANFCCEACGRSLYTLEVGWTFPHSFHHRRPRGMGGTTRPETNSPANLLLLCGTGTSNCHGWIEANRTWAISLGLLLPQTADPAGTVVELLRGRVTLTDHGTYLEAS